MSALAAKRGAPLAPGEWRPLRRRRAIHVVAPAGGGTLDDRITGIWRDLVERGVAECAVCGAEVRAARPCGTCGSQLG